MSDEAISELLARATFSFVGTIEHVGASTMGELPIDERTAVVHVDHVLHAPAAFSQMAGSRVTVQLDSNADPPAVGEALAFFANGLAFGESLAVSEVGRLPLSAVEPHLAAAAAGEVATPFAPLHERLERDRLRKHAGEADAIVLARVVKLEKAPHTGFSEHDPDWWIATLDVHHVERGEVEPGEVAVLYPNSLDVRWHGAPKPKAGQEGLWVLHASEGDLREAAPFRIEHEEDYRPTYGLQSLRDEGDAVPL
jgi:hypothetical protein